MANKVTRNEIPSVEEVKEAMLSVLASGRARAFDGIFGDVAKQLEISRAQRAYRVGKSEHTLFENRCVQARIELVKAGAITYRAGKVKLVKGAVSAVKTHREPVAKSADSVPVSHSAQKAPEGRPTKCLSFQEPSASYIVTGVKDAEFRSKKVNVPIRNLVVCASKTPRIYPDYIPGLAYGLAIGMVDVVECIDVGEKRAWKLENPRLIKPFPVHATAGFFYVANVPEVISNTPESYREHVLPLCFRGERDLEDCIVASLFSVYPDDIQKYFEVDCEKFDLVKRCR